MSETNQKSLTYSEKADFILKLMKGLNLDKAIVFGASWGGTFSIPFMMKHPQHMIAHIAMATVGSEKFNSDEYRQVKVNCSCSLGR